MSYHYSNPARADDTYALQDVWVTQLTAHEVAAQDEDLIHQYLRMPEFKIATMNSRTYDAMMDAIVENEGITGGWCWCYCLPGCLPDSGFNGPFATKAEAIADMRRLQDLE